MAKIDFYLNSIKLQTEMQYITETLLSIGLPLSEYNGKLMYKCDMVTWEIDKSSIRFLPSWFKNNKVVETILMYYAKSANAGHIIAKFLDSEFYLRLLSVLNTTKTNIVLSLDIRPTHLNYEINIYFEKDFCLTFILSFTSAMIAKSSSSSIVYRHVLKYSLCHKFGMHMQCVPDGLKRVPYTDSLDAEIIMFCNHIVKNTFMPDVMKKETSSSKLDTTCQILKLYSDNYISIMSELKQVFKLESFNEILPITGLKRHIIIDFVGYKLHINKDVIDISTDQALHRAVDFVRKIKPQLIL